MSEYTKYDGHKVTWEQIDRLNELLSKLINKLVDIEFK